MISCCSGCLYTSPSLGPQAGSRALYKGLGLRLEISQARAPPSWACTSLIAEGLLLKKEEDKDAMDQGWREEKILLLSA